MATDKRTKDDLIGLGILACAIGVIFPLTLWMHSADWGNWKMSLVSALQVYVWGMSWLISLALSFVLACGLAQTAAEAVARRGSGS